MRNKNDSRGSSGTDSSAFLADGSDQRERKRQPRYLFSAAMTVRLKGGMAMSGMSVEISAAGKGR
jgi:hypothetical protein